MRVAIVWALGVLSACGAPASGPGREAARIGRVEAEAPLVATPALRAAIQAGVRRRGANEASFEVDSFVAALVVEDVAGGGGGLRVEPALEQGRQVGYRVLAVAEGSAYAAVGLRAGDVVESISGVRLDSPGRAAGVLAASERGATIELQREGVGSTIEVRVADRLAWSVLRGARTPADGPSGQVAGDIPEEPREEAPLPWAPKGKPGHTSGGGYVPGSGSGGGHASTPTGDHSGGGTPAATGVRCASAASCTIDRRTFDSALASPDKVMRQVDFTSAPKGYKLTRVAPGSAVSGLGFRVGDTLISVNGSRLDDDVAALGLYMGLSSTKRFNVVYERGGVRSTKTIVVD